MGTSSNYQYGLVGPAIQIRRRNESGTESSCSLPASHERSANPLPAYVSVPELAGIHVQARFLHWTMEAEAVKITWWKRQPPPILEHCQAGVENIIAGTWSCPLRWCWMSESEPDPSGCVYERYKQALKEGENG